MKKVDYQKTLDYMVKWIEEKAKEANMKSLVIGISGGIDSSVTAAICSRTSLKVIGVSMPCHSGEASGKRAEELARHLGIIYHKTDLSEAYDLISNQLDVSFINKEHRKYAEGSFRSRMRTPVLGYVAKVYNGLIAGTGNRNEDELIRYYDKGGDAIVDIGVLGSLFKREVYEMGEFLGLPKNILEAVPSAELWGDEEHTDEAELGMTYDEVEWVERHMIKNNLPLTGEEMIIESTNFDKDSREYFLLREVASHEIKTRHKVNPNLPVCIIPESVKGDI